MIQGLKDILLNSKYPENAPVQHTIPTGAGEEALWGRLVQAGLNHVATGYRGVVVTHLTEDIAA